MNVIDFLDARDTEGKPIFKALTMHPTVVGEINTATGFRERSLHPDDIEMLDFIAERLAEKIGHRVRWVWWR